MITTILYFFTFMITQEKEQSVNNDSQRVTRTAVIVADAPVEKVFPLFGPVKEKLWAYGWDPKIIFPNNKDVEEHMIFQTPGRFEREEQYTWAITQYVPANYLIEYTVSTSERIWFIRVACESAGQKTRATVTYTYTGLSAKGIERNNQALEKMYAHDLKDWEEAINYFLKTGKQKH